MSRVDITPMIHGDYDDEVAAAPASHAPVHTHARTQPMPAHSQQAYAAAQHVPPHAPPPAHATHAYPGAEKGVPAGVAAGMVAGGTFYDTLAAHRWTLLAIIVVIVLILAFMWLTSGNNAEAAQTPAPGAAAGGGAPLTPQQQAQMQAQQQAQQQAQHAYMQAQQAQPPANANASANTTTAVPPKTRPGNGPVAGANAMPSVEEIRKTMEQNRARATPTAPNQHNEDEIAQLMTQPDAHAHAHDDAADNDAGVIADEADG